MRYALSDHMTMRRLIRVSVPAILMMVAISIYSVVDGFFISNFAGPGTTPFASVNLIYPPIMILGGLGFMMGTGGSALSAKRLGEGDEEGARRAFSNSVLVSVVLGVVSSALFIAFTPQIATLLGADEAMLPYCVTYGRVMAIGITFFNLQNLFQAFFSAAAKTHLGFYVTLLAGVTNIVMDAILIVGCQLNVLGAAIGTILGQAVGAVVPLIYFIAKKNEPLRLRMQRLEWDAVGKSMANGMSEFVNNISASVVSMALNVQLMQIYGEDGVGAYGIICYVWLVFAATFIGINIAVSPRISYALGAKNKAELRGLVGKSLLLLIIAGGLMCAFAEAMAIPLAMAFGGKNESLYELTVTASRIYSLIYLFLGINMFGSALFTALNNGVVSMLLSVIRLLGLELGFVLLLPLSGLPNAIWFAVPFANAVGMGVVIATIAGYRYRYGYGKERGPEPS